MSRELSLLEGEEVRLKLKPHFLSFFSMYILCFVLIIMGLLMLTLFESGRWEELSEDHLTDMSFMGIEAEAATATVIWVAFLLILGFIGLCFILYA